MGRQVNISMMLVLIVHISQIVVSFQASDFVGSDAENLNVNMNDVSINIDQPEAFVAEESIGLEQSEQSDILPPPYFRLRSVYGEPKGYGWGIDIPGYGPTLNLSGLLQAHTLKPAEGGEHEDMHQVLVTSKIQGSQVVLLDAGQVYGSIIYTQEGGQGRGL